MIIKNIVISQLKYKIWHKKYKRGIEMERLIKKIIGDLSKQLDTLSAFGISITFEIKDDGTAILNTNGQETKLKVDTDKKTISKEKRWTGCD